MDLEWEYSASCHHTLQCQVKDMCLTSNNSELHSFQRAIDALTLPPASCLLPPGSFVSAMCSQAKLNPVRTHCISQLGREDTNTLAFRKALTLQSFL